MRFTREGKKPIEPVSEKQLRRQLGFKGGGDNTYAILEAPDGSYAQMLGGGVACCMEWRDTTTHRHYRAYLAVPKVPWREPARLGTVLLRPEEFLFIADVIEAFCAFLNSQDFPPFIRWRDVTDELAACGVQRP